MIKSLLTSALAATLSLASLGASAQEYPNRPLRLVVPFAPGGGADIVARAIAGPLAKRLGQQIVVENRAGAGATLGADSVAKAPADGYSLLYTTPGPQITNPFLMAKMPYDPEKDLVPVSLIAVLPSMLVVPADLPVRNLRELIDYARANPGKVNFSSSGTGATSHLAGELFKQSAGLDIVHVSYRGTGAALVDLLSGQVQMSIDSLAVYKPHIESGKLRALGVSTLERWPQMPEVPPIAEVIPGFDGSPVNYLTVRGGTPTAIIDRLNRELNAVLEAPEVREQLLKNGVLAKGSTPEEMAALIRTESLKWKRVIQVSGAKAE